MDKTKIMGILALGLAQSLYSNNDYHVFRQERIILDSYRSERRNPQYGMPPLRVFQGRKQRLVKSSFDKQLEKEKKTPKGFLKMPNGKKVTSSLENKVVVESPFNVPSDYRKTSINDQYAPRRDCSTGSCDINNSRFERPVYRESRFTNSNPHNFVPIYSRDSRFRDSRMVHPNFEDPVYRVDPRFGRHEPQYDMGGCETNCNMRPQFGGKRRNVFQKTGREIKKAVKILKFW